MGVGKSTVGRRLAERLRVAFVDLDERLVQTSGRAVAEMIAELGLGGFRRLGAATRGRLLDGSRTGEGGLPPGAVLALGGGTVLSSRALRHRLLDEGLLVTLVADPAARVRRLGPAERAGRPLLAGLDAAGVAATLAQLDEERAPVYAEAHAQVDAEGPVEQVVDRLEQLVAGMRGRPPLVVPLGTATYPVTIGAGCRRELGAMVGPARPAVVVTDAHVARCWPGEVARLLSSPPLRDRFDGTEDAGGAEGIVTVVVPPGEPSKDTGQLVRVWDAALDAAAHRGSPVVAFGGGVVGDLAGLAAATLHRGVPLVQLPTSLLAMVDSSVGGKTAIDRPQGKNLVGAFHQPRGVLCDPELLRTLPAEERVAGLAEVAKAAWLAGEADVAFLEAQADALRRGNDPAVDAEAIRRAVRLKIRLVVEDERETTGRRALLNLGHTFGHAFEAAGGLGSLRHGEAVALGLVAAFRVAVALGEADREDAARMATLLRKLGLGGVVDGLDARLRDPALPALLALDKKRRSTREVRFIVPRAPGATRLADLPLARLPALARSPAEAAGEGHGPT